MTIRRSPLGYLIEEREEGLYLHAAHDIAEVRRALQKDLAWHVATQTHTADPFADPSTLVEIGYGPKPEDGWAEWGKGPDEETAWRYALGAHFGSYEDPIVMYDPLIGEYEAGPQ